ncbi:hypothetical protein AVEN_202972-1 [Araneus ventricosus]|uniref:Uncharacterized protein n=1 Tax=Araneus ventricosus TaxID=182803 RepID=A0A4Y2FXN1_ARAVE|nr:hypothetical protein AVEN_202972-1 [Araneus ventricosus]
MTSRGCCTWARPTHVIQGLESQTLSHLHDDQSGLMHKTFLETLDLNAPVLTSLPCSRADSRLKSRQLTPRGCYCAAMSTQGLPPDPVMADVNFTSGNFRPSKMLYMSVVITRWSAHSPNSRCYVDKQRASFTKIQSGPKNTSIEASNMSLHFQNLHAD